MDSFIKILFATLVYGLVHSLLAANWVKALAQRWLGSLADQGYRLAFNLFAVLSLLPVLGLTAMLPDISLYSIPMPWMLAPLLIEASAILALGAGLLQTGALEFLGIQQLAELKPKKPGRLVTKGMYRWVRHPLYTAGLVFIWFAPVMTLNLLALNLGLTIYIVFGAMLEERKMLAEFGPAYEAYAQRTPMLIPRAPKSELDEAL